MKKALLIAHILLAVTLISACQETSTSPGPLRDAGSRPDQGTIPKLLVRAGGGSFSSNIKSIVQFSEAMYTAKAFSAISVMNTAKKSAHQTVHASPTAENRAVSLDMPPGVKMKDKLRITIGMDVSAVSGVKLDGEYTLTAGSGPFSIELVPANQANHHWKPVANL